MNEKYVQAVDSQSDYPTDWWLRDIKKSSNSTSLSLLFINRNESKNEF